jgi:DNA-binding CsgD family transcriptional regulator
VFFFDRKRMLEGGYSDSPDGAGTRPLYMTEFHGRRGRELGGAFPDNARTQVGVQDRADAHGAIGVDMDRFLRSDFCNLSYRPSRSHWFMRLMVREGGTGRALGCVTLYRGPQDRPWSPADKRRLAGLAPFLAQVLGEASTGEDPLVDSGRRGLIIADRTGRVVHLSRPGLHLLGLAIDPDFRQQGEVGQGGRLPAPLVRICRDIDRIFSDDPTAPAPVYRHQNIWGGFRFEAQWLDAGDRASGLIGITISHEEPAGLRLARRVADLPLSRRQAEVCLLMAQGHSSAAIAARLCMARHAAIPHGRWIYDRLGAHNRIEVVNRLLSRANGTDESG